MFVHISYYSLGRDFLEENDSGKEMYISVSLCLGMCAKSLSYFFAFRLIKIFFKYAFISFTHLETRDYNSFHLVDAC